MSEHTKGPWAFYMGVSNQTAFIKSEAGDLISYGEASEADARRIVACVNACEGISTDSLECLPLTANSVMALGALQQQRGELLAALKEFVAAGENSVNSDDGIGAMIRFGEAEADAKRLIAEVEGAE